ncbi:MAG: hypothetical protein FJ109_00095 [Deltaproteobacteria bacterium]|nr:hypothetical protein [Deltaproteobacteria bacterium]
MSMKKIPLMLILAALVLAGCKGNSDGTTTGDVRTGDTTVADGTTDGFTTDTTARTDSGETPGTDMLQELFQESLGQDAEASDIPQTDLAQDTPDPLDQLETPDGESSLDTASDVEPQSGVCPVIGYEACGGDLIGKWKFLDMCPDDPKAANDLCESPFDNLPACIGGGNDILCDSVIDGTLEFIDSDTAKMVSEHWIVFSWVFTDACLVAAGQPGADAEARCLSLSSEKLSCTYAPDACTCSGASWKEPDDTEFPYTAAGSELTLFQDKINASYCITGDQLVIDHYFYHPVSWRYWVLEKATEEPPPQSLTLEQAQALLPGVWEGVAFADSSNPIEPVPPGFFNVFFEDGKFTFKCGKPSNVTWKLIEKWGFPTVEVTLSPGSVVYWVIQELTETSLHYIEGGDSFYYERRADCP